MTNGCPTLDDWIALANGRVSEDVLVALVEHVDACPSCEAKLAHWDAPQESFLTPLPRLRDRPAPEHDAALASLCERLASGTAKFGDETTPLETRQAPAAPRSFGPYELREPLGRGGMGVVYKAWHRHLERFVAIKLVALHRQSDEQFRRRFAREMASIGKIDSPHVVRALDAGIEGEQQFLVMELIEGRDVGSLLKRAGKLPIAAACEIARQAALGLEAVRAHGLVHRDIKPSNLFLCRGGVVKLLDLGLARPCDDDADLSQLTASQQLLGTPDFISPEQIQQDGPIDIRADLYSLGCAIFQLLAGRAPFAEAGSHAKKLVAHCSIAPPDLHALRPEIPRPLALIVARLLAKTPAQRYASPLDVAAALAPFASGAELDALLNLEPRVAVQGGAIVQPEGRKSLPWRWLLPLAGTVALGVTALVAINLSAFIQPDAEPGSGSSTEAAPSNLRAAPPAKLLVWQNLLDVEPREVFWPRDDGVSTWRRDPEAEVLGYNASKYGAVAFGRSDAEYYKVDIGLRQERWHGGIGLYIGGHETGEDGKPARSCQVIMIQCRKKDPPDFVLTRLHYTPETIDSRAVASIPPPIGEQALECEIREGRLEHVRLNGVAYPALTDVAVTRRFQPRDQAGEIGLFVNCSQGNVVRARYMLLKDAGR